MKLALNRKHCSTKNSVQMSKPALNFQPNKTLKLTVAKGIKMVSFTIISLQWGLCPVL